MSSNGLCQLSMLSSASLSDPYRKFRNGNRKLSHGQKFQLPVRGLFLHNRKLIPPVRRIILRKQRKKLPVEVKIQGVGSSTGEVAGYTRKLRSIKYLTGTWKRVIFQIMFLSGNVTITGIISDFQKGGSYLTNDKPQATKLVDIIPLQAIKTISLSFQEQVHTIRECPAEMFDAFICQYVEVENVNREVWSAFQRWRIINFLLDDGALEVENDMLVEVQEPALEPAQEGA